MNNESFELGEIATYYPYGTYQKVLEKYKGEDVEIDEPLGNYHPRGLLVYGVKFADGFEAYVQPKSLRKKPSKQESKDIEETRKKGAPSWTEMMKSLNTKTLEKLS